MVVSPVVLKGPVAIIDKKLDEHEKKAHWEFFMRKNGNIPLVFEHKHYLMTISRRLSTSR